GGALRGCRMIVSRSSLFRRSRASGIVVVAAVLVLLAARGVLAAPVKPIAGGAKTSPVSSGYSPQAPYRAALLIDRDSGNVFFAKNEHLRWPPASMTKMMTLLIAMEAVKDKTISLDDMIITSDWASKIGGSQVYLRAGEQFPLRDMLEAIV